MPRNRKLFIHNTPTLLTARTEEGLPFLPSLYMNFILWGILARARNLYQVKICHFIFMANHLHMLVVIQDPAHLDDFMRYVKTESAHAVNRLWGRRKHTVWCDGYDSPIILTPEDVIRYIVYIYTNPLSSERIPIDSFRGVSSWKLFKKDNLLRSCPWIKRKDIPRLAKLLLTEGKQKQLLANLQKQKSGICAFVLEPNAWMQCFQETSNQTPESINKQIFELIENAAVKSLRTREQSKKIDEQRIKHHQPKKFSPRMICLCSDISARNQYINWFRSLCSKASMAFHRLTSGLPPQYPPGFFAPGGYLGANLLPHAILQ